MLTINTTCYVSFRPINLQVDLDDLSGRSCDELLTRLLDVPAAFYHNSFKSFQSAFKDWMQIQKCYQKHQQTEGRMQNAWRRSQSQSVTSIMLWRKREGNENDQRNNHLDANVSLHVDTNYNQITEDMHKFFGFAETFSYFFFLKQTRGPVKSRNLGSHVILLLHLIYMKWSCSERMWCNMIKKQLQKSTRLILQSKTGRWAVETIEIRNKKTSECSFSVWLAAELWEVKCHISAERLRMGKCLNVKVKH